MGYLQDGSTSRSYINETYKNRLVLNTTFIYHLTSLQQFIFTRFDRQRLKIAVKDITAHQQTVFIDNPTYRANAFKNAKCCTSTPQSSLCECADVVNLKQSC